MSCTTTLYMIEYRYIFCQLYKKNMAKLTLTLKKIDKISDKIRQELAHMIIRDSSPYTPYQTGTLEKKRYYIK